MNHSIRKLVFVLLVVVASVSSIIAAETNCDWIAMEKSGEDIIISLQPAAGGKLDTFKYKAGGASIDTFSGALSGFKTNEISLELPKLSLASDSNPKNNNGFYSVSLSDSPEKKLSFKFQRPESAKDGYVKVKFIGLTAPGAAETKFTVSSSKAAISVVDGSTVKFTFTPTVIHNEKALLSHLSGNAFFVASRVGDSNDITIVNAGEGNVVAGDLVYMYSKHASDSLKSYIVKIPRNTAKSKMQQGTEALMAFAIVAALWFVASVGSAHIFHFIDPSGYKWGATASGLGSMLSKLSPVYPKVSAPKSRDITDYDTDPEIDEIEEPEDNTEDPDNSSGGRKQNRSAGGKDNNVDDETSEGFDSIDDDGVIDDGDTVTDTTDGFSTAAISLVALLIPCLL